MNCNADIIVIGAGIVGCATAMQLLKVNPRFKILVIEKETDLARHQTGRNSGVIHSGLYYKPGSLKARNCREGYKQLLQFCLEQEIPYQICGKLVVATSNHELAQLDELHKRGLANGLQNLRKVSRAEIVEIEPHCSGIAGLFVPETGIVDYRQVTKKYADKIKQAGGEIQLGEEVLNIYSHVNHVEVIGRNKSWTAKALIICAGLYSDRLALKTEKKLPIRILPFRGEYFKLKDSARHLIKNLIYPVPNPAFPFLGVHFTRMIDSEVECGPNAVFAFGREAYKKTDFNLRDALESILWPGFRKITRKYWREGLGELHRSLSKKAFVQALQKLVPEIKAEHLEPAEAGIRAQACDVQGNLLDDFYIINHERVVQVCNAPSPAATASLAIGQYLAEQITQKIN